MDSVLTSGVLTSVIAKFFGRLGLPCYPGHAMSSTNAGDARRVTTLACHSMPSGSGWRSAPSSRSETTTSPRNGESGHLAADVGGHFATDVASGVATQSNYGPNKESEI